MSSNGKTADWIARPGRKLRVLVKRILKKTGYPSGKQEKATETVRARAGCPRRNGRRLPNGTVANRTFPIEATPGRW